MRIKGTMSVILSDKDDKDDIVRLTTGFLSDLTDQVGIKYHMFEIRCFQFWFRYKSNMRISVTGKHENYQNQTLQS